MAFGKMQLFGGGDNLIMCSYGRKVWRRGRAAYHTVWQINIHSHVGCGTMLQMTSVLPVHISVSICVYLFSLILFQTLFFPDGGKIILVKLQSLIIGQK